MRIRKSYLVIIVFALALFAGISIFNRKPDVDHDYDLEFEKLNNDVFDFTGTIWEGRQISLITVNDKNMDASYEALGIEPDKKLPKKSVNPVFFRRNLRFLSKCMNVFQYFQTNLNAILMPFPLILTLF